MDDKEFSNVFAIPANYTDSGKILGGMLEPRNAVEALVLIVLVGYPELMLIPMPSTIRIVVMTVHKVINDKVHGPYQLGIYTREDLFQIGCIGLCKAAATDKGGNFSTYAYRLIWNQICDALIYSTRRQANETTYDVTPYTAEQDDTDIELGIAIDQALDKAKLDAPPSTVKGIDAIRLMSEGYTCREIGEQIGATDKQVAAMVSKARKFLKSRKDVLDLAGNI